MKSDLYTKFVLTVIALALSAIAIQLTTKDAHAQSGGFRFTETGALMVAKCEPVYESFPTRVYCEALAPGGWRLVEPKK
jgi:hypothetical protein